MIDYADVLKDRIWEHPRDYGGFSPDGDYVVLTHNRDSGLCERSNYYCGFRDLKKLARELGAEDTVYDFRAGHWAVGWVEYVIVERHAPEAVLIEAAEIICAIENYCIYDDDDFSNREYEELTHIWDHMSVRERKEYFDPDNREGQNIFCIRGDGIPSSCFDSMRDGWSL